MGLAEVVSGAVGGFRAPCAVAAISPFEGQADIVAVGIDAEALFEVGSITKLMTATLVLQHVATGDLDLDDPVVNHIPAVRLDPPKMTSSVTIRHLLTHTSGIDCGEDFTDTGPDDDCLERYVDAAVTGSRLLHPPGQRWSYSNGAYSLLGHLVERLDGRCWDDALIDRILDLLGLTATTTARLHSSTKTATGHRFDSAVRALVEEPGRMPRSAGPAGNVVATANDLILFATALLDGSGRLLPPELVAEMTRPQAAIRDTSQALGWSSPAPGVLVHGGATRGFTAFLGAVPGVGSLAVVANGPGAPFIASALQAHLFGQRQPATPGPGTGDDVELAACEGRYSRRHVEQVVERSGDELVADGHFAPPLSDLFPKPEPVHLAPLGGGRFVSQRDHEDTPTIWDFSDPGDDGCPTMLLTQRLHRRAD